MGGHRGINCSQKAPRGTQIEWKCNFYFHAKKRFDSLLLP